ncbi:hypothetical protein [Amycolatopsis sp. lyj-84]|uniref:hypothetical protein n=1 Tax=Amycolatopsis sp. lyj-84 TaxID=2789284 RepID=UPI003979BC7B
MPDHHEPEDPLTRLYLLANLVSSDLAVAGIPLVPDYLHGGHPLGPVGAHVFADNLGHRGVFISWVSHSILTSASLEAWSEGRTGQDNPAGQWKSTIDTAMQNAMATILSSIGYEVVTADDESEAELVVTARAAGGPWWDWYRDQTDRVRAKSLDTAERLRTTTGEHGQ